MAIPEKPESRAEMYLNRIASGSGTIPAQPESRLEQYLDAIANNGGGGGSGGGVETVNVTFASSANMYVVRVYAVTLRGNATYYGSAFNVTPDSPATIAIPKYGTGSVHIDLRGNAVQFERISNTVMPQVTGDATLDMSTGEWTINGDCTFTAAGEQ